MGYNSTIMICNDVISEIEDDPGGWWKKAWAALMKCMSRGPVEFGHGCSVNGYTAVAQHHADTVSLIAVGGNYATVIWQGFRGNEGHHTKNQIVKLLALAAMEHGYVLEREHKR